MRPTKQTMGWTAILIGASLVLATAACAADDGVPVRKPGHWRITSISAALGMRTIDACIGPQDSIAASGKSDTCEAPRVEHAADQVIVTVDCTSPRGRERISTLFTGDFTTWYRGIAKLSYEPQTEGRTNLGVTLDAKYIGACENADAKAVP